MSHTQKRFIHTFFISIAILFSGCSKQPDPQSNKTDNNTPQQAVKKDNSEKPKKKPSIDKIDFSKSPGVIKAGAFGYYFGLTPDLIKATGIELESDESAGNLSIYTTESAPSPWNGGEKYSLIFYKEKLLKIIAIGRDITGDSNGSTGKEEFNALRESLIEKYGKPKKSFHKVGITLYQESDEFYQCLAYDGCGLWMDLFETEDKIILIKLGGIKRGTGFIKITYESNPEWSNSIDEHQEDLKEKTKKGL